MKNRMKTALQLFLAYLKIGAFTFGGGYAMIPLIQKEISEKKKWITDDDLLEIIAISESTPGPIAINCATFVGYKICGVAGSLASTLGVVLPSFVIIILISMVLRWFESLRAVSFAFQGIRAGVLALILKALFSLGKECPRNIFSIVTALAAFVSVAFFGVSVFYVIIACAVSGLVFSLFQARRHA